MQAGFEVQLLSYFNSLLYPPIAAARLIGKARGNGSADDALPSAKVNGVLNTVFGLEAGTDRPRADAVRSQPGRGGAAAAGAVKPARIRAARKH